VPVLPHGSRERLCDAPEFTAGRRSTAASPSTSWRSPRSSTLPEGFTDLNAAPLLCAGIIGFRGLRRTGIRDWRGARLGIYGFGAAGHVAIQLARARGADVYVATRDRERHQALASELGARWVGGTFERPPVPGCRAVLRPRRGRPSPPPSRRQGGTLVPRHPHE
jgi:propanol-preferring alcohol dehydrogenase